MQDSRPRGPGPCWGRRPRMARGGEGEAAAEEGWGRHTWRPGVAPALLPSLPPPTPALGPMNPHFQPHRRSPATLARHVESMSRLGDLRSLRGAARAPEGRARQSGGRGSRSDGRCAGLDPTQQGRCPPALALPARRPPAGGRRAGAGLTGARCRACAGAACPWRHPGPGGSGQTTETRGGRSSTGSTSGRARPLVATAGRPPRTRPVRRCQPLPSVPAHHVEAPRPGQLRGLLRRAARGRQHIRQRALAAVLCGGSEGGWVGCGRPGISGAASARLRCSRLGWAGRWATQARACTGGGLPCASSAWASLARSSPRTRHHGRRPRADSHELHNVGVPQACAAAEVRGPGGTSARRPCCAPYLAAGRCAGRRDWSQQTGSQGFQCDAARVPCGNH